MSGVEVFLAVAAAALLVSLALFVWAVVRLVSAILAKVK